MNSPATPTGPPAGRSEPNEDLLYSVEQVLITTPAYPKMRQDQNIQGWSTDLVQLRQRDDLRPMARALEDIEQLFMPSGSFSSLRERLTQDCAGIDLDALARACQASEEATASPYARFILAWSALYLWILDATRRGENLFDDAPWEGWPNPGWGRIPATCIDQATRLNGLHWSRQLAELSYGVLQTSWRRSMGERQALEPGIARYRRLLQAIEARQDSATASLADELRDACTGEPNRVRALLAALFWSFGLIPECFALRAAPSQPSRRLYPGVDLRSHEALFTIFNHPWDQWWLDDLYPTFGLSAAPSRLYVRALTSVMAGKPDATAAAEYFRAYDLLFGENTSMLPHGFMRHRLHMLAHVLGEQLGRYGPEFTYEKRLEIFEEKVQTTAHARAQATRHPARPDILGRTSHAAFELIELCLAQDTKLQLPEGTRCVRVIELIERFRTGALAYWLQVDPPLVSSHGNPALEGLLQDEQSELERLRGAYFLTLRPVLPMHFMWSDMDMHDLAELNRNPGRREWFYSPDVARREIDEIEQRLADIADRVAAHAPDYAARRRNPSVNVEQLVSLLNRHNRPMRA